MLECVVNVSEGRDRRSIDAIAAEATDDLLDLHVDADHHRCVLTLVGEEAPRRVAAAAVERLDLRTHVGVHPRLGVVDVVPFVALADTEEAEAVRARDAFASWIGDELGVPAFVYGPERSLPEVRRQAFRDLRPAHGPDRRHPTAGAVAVGARPVLVAYNLLLTGVALDRARQIARDLLGPEVRALAFPVRDGVQVSMNLVDPLVVGPADVYDRVDAEEPVARAELVGLVPAAVLQATDASRWARLDLDEARTIEARLEARRLGRARDR